MRCTVHRTRTAACKTELHLWPIRVADWTARADRAMDAGMRPLNPVAASDLLAREPAARMIDVRLPVACARLHVAGALQACVFEVGFLDACAKLVPDPAAPLIICGDAAPDRSAEMAADKLHRAGRVIAGWVDGGLPGWIAAGLPTEGGREEAPSPAPLHGLVPLDLAESRVEWTGRNLLNRHRGSVALKQGFLEFESGRLVGGECVADLRQIRCSDITDAPMNRLLVAHLESDDFFDVARFPEAHFRIHRAEPIEGRGPGSPNLRVIGEMQLKGITAPLTLEAAAGWTSDGRPAAQALVPFDRTLWNVIYGSGRLFRELGGHLVNDLVELELRIVAGQKSSA
jgi:polyisoprenoid-binding protein YceI/rhodanese-related sulfurtransferase